MFGPPASIEPTPISVIMTLCIMCRLNEQEVEDDSHVRSHEKKKNILAEFE